MPTETKHGNYWTRVVVRRVLRNWKNAHSNHATTDRSKSEMIVDVRAHLSDFEDSEDRELSLQALNEAGELIWTKGFRFKPVAAPYEYYRPDDPNREISTWVSERVRIYIPYTPDIHTIQARIRRSPVAYPAGPRSPHRRTVQLWSTLSNRRCFVFHDLPTPPTTGSPQKMPWRSTSTTSWSKSPPMFVSKPTQNPRSDQAISPPTDFLNPIVSPVNGLSKPKHDPQRADLLQNQVWTDTPFPLDGQYEAAATKYPFSHLYHILCRKFWHKLSPIGQWTNPHSRSPDPRGSTPQCLYPQ